MSGNIVVSTLLVLSISHSSCVFVPDEKISFSSLKMENPTLSSSLVSGVPSHQIKDVWVYADENALGVYGLPTLVPIEVGDGSANLKIRAGIHPNGNNSSSVEYPFFDEIVTFIPLEEGKQTSIPLSFQYKKEAVFDFIEDFENTNLFTEDVDGNDKTFVKRIETASLYGSYAGIIELQGENDAIEVTHFTRFLGSNNKKGSVFLEFDYKGDEKFFVGTILEKGSNLIKSYKVLVTESATWNHFYLELTQEISKSDVVSYKVVFSSTIGSGKSKSTVYLDNIKLIHF